MTAATAATPHRFGLHTRGMAVGLASGLAAIAFAALLPDAVAYIYLGAQLAGIGWVYFGFGVADGRPSAIAVQVLSAGAFLTVGFLGAYHESTALLGVGFLAHGGWDWLHHNDHGPTHVRTWYPPFCVVADVVIGLPLLAGWVLSFTHLRPREGAGRDRRACRPPAVTALAVRCPAGAVASGRRR